MEETMKDYYIYIMANQKNGTLYLGMTNDLIRRAYEHKEGIFDGFTKRYKIHRLVYFEHTHDVYAALGREKQIKNWKREWKVRLIEKSNPEWIDLYDSLLK
jgi:putative endonuclease